MRQIIYHQEASRRSSSRCARHLHQHLRAERMFHNHHLLNPLVLRLLNTRQGVNESSQNTAAPSAPVVSCRFWR